MEKSDLLLIKEQLQAKLDFCVSCINEPTTFENSADDLDNAVNVSAQQKILKDIANKQREATDIQRALASIELGNYGICECCGEDIPVKRLMALPTANLCIECKTREEE